MPTKSRNLLIKKNLIRKKITLKIHTGNMLKTRKLTTKGLIHLHIGELAYTKRTGKTIHNSQKKKKKKMKKQGLDIFLKNSRTLYKKNIIKNIKLKTKIIAGGAVKKPPLSSLLATIGVNTENFINIFNSKTSTLFGIDDVLLSIKLIITPAKTFDFTWNLPTIYKLIKKIFPKWNWDYKINDHYYKKIVTSIIYKIALATLKKKKNKKKQIYSKMREIYGSARSWDMFELTDHAKDKKRQKKKSNK